MRAIILALAAILVLGGCAVPRAAVEIRNDTAKRGYDASRVLSGNLRQMFDKTFAAESEAHFAKLQADYENLIETSDQGTSDPATIARRGAIALSAYQQGLIATREHMQRRAAAHYRLCVLANSLGDAIVGVDQMANVEREVTDAEVKAVIDSGIMDTFMTILDALETKYAPAESRIAQSQRRSP